MNSSSIRLASLSSFRYFFRQIHMSISSTTSRIITTLMLTLTSERSAGCSSLTENLYWAVCTQNYLSVLGRGSDLTN